MTHVGQSGGDTVAFFFDERRYMRVPGKVPVENHAKIPDGMALMDRVLAEPNGHRVWDMLLMRFFFFQKCILIDLI